MSQYAFGHTVTIKKPTTNQAPQVVGRYQNFFIGQDITLSGQTFNFAPFGFSGVTVTRSGDGLEASLVFPNNSITRSWAVDSVDHHYVMEVTVLIIDSANKNGPHTTVHNYTGQVVGGGWDNVSLNLQLSSVLDAVGTDVPRRSLDRQTVGNLPIANNVRLQ
jgi:hypothetical protein